MAGKKITLTVVDKLADGVCHRGHRTGDSFDYETERGRVCPMAMHVAFPYIDILKYGGKVPLSSHGDVRFCCPDCDIANVFRIDVEE